MSSPPQSTNQNNSNPAQDSLERESGSISQSQQPPIVSSPLFFNSSNPGSDIGNFNSQSQSQSQRRNDISSPLHYTSSAQPTSDIGGFDSQRSARVQDVGRIMRRAQRSDVTDSVSSPQRSRRYFTQGRGNGPSNLNSSTSAQFSTDPAEPNDEPVRVIWGTNVSIQECSNIFRDFLLSFKYKYRRELEEQAIEPEDHELYYVNQLNNIIELGLTNLNLDAKNLLSYPSTRKLYYQLINYPQEIIPIMDHTIKDCLIQIINDANATTSPAQSKLDEIETNVYTIRPYNVNLVEKGIRELNPNDIDKLVSVKGLTLRSTSIIPDMKVAFFRCNACGHTVGVEIDRGVISEPTKCPRSMWSNQFNGTYS